MILKIYDKIKFWLIIFWLPILLISLFMGLNYSISGISFMPTQPVRFSHKIHSGMFEIKCLFCHAESEISSFSPIPTTYSCMVCHIALKTETKLMKPVIESYEKKIPIKWNRIYRLPEHTHFDHSRHIRSMIDCSSCHGNVDSMEEIFMVRELSMKWCLDCHRNPKEFIIRPRNITGIFVYPDSLINVKDFIVSSKSIIDPEYGMYYSDPPKVKKGFYMPNLPSRTSENCSSCHY